MDLGDTIDDNFGIDDDQPVMTAQSALEELENAWLNEKFAPEILPHNYELVEIMLQQIGHMEENIKRLSKNDIRQSVHKMELERIRYVMTGYLRTRLDKIERFAIVIIAEESRRPPEESYLTPGEFKYAKDYLQTVENLFTTVALQHMPGAFQKFDVKTLAVKPNLYSHVFLRANKDVNGIIVPGTMDDEVDFKTGSQHLIQYIAVADLVKDGSVQLI